MKIKDVCLQVYFYDGWVSKKRIIKSRSISRVLFSDERNACHLSGIVVANNLVRPTLQHRTSNPQSLVYMALQPIRRTAANVAISTGRLLPHLFTLIPPKRDGSFLLRYSALANSFPLGNMALCVARTFLFDERSDKPTCFLTTKIVHFNNTAYTLCSEQLFSIAYKEWK